MSQYNYNQMLRDGLNIIDNNYNNAANLGELLQYGPNGLQLWNPAIDLMESVNSILLVVYIPGVSRESLNISFMANYIIIGGRRDFPNYPPLQDNVLNNRTQEIIYGNFERRVRLPIIVNDRENVDITLNNGVLNVNINKDIDYNTTITFNSEDIV